MPAPLRNIIFLFFYFFTHFFFYQSKCFAQDSLALLSQQLQSKAEVQWIGTWPNEQSKNQKKDFKAHLGELVFGKKNQELKRPVAVLASGENSLWALDQESNSVFFINAKTYSKPHYIEKRSKYFSSLVAMCAFRENEILFTDSYTNKIFLINSQKKECSILNDSLKLNKITGIAYSPISKQIWVLETGEHRIQVLNEQGRIVKTIGARGNEKGEFNFPTHLWIDAAGNAFVVDAMNFRIQIFNKDGDVISMFGKSGDASGYFASPKGIATDSFGNIYVVDALFHVVQIFDFKGNFLYSFGSQGHDEGQFWMPSGIYIDSKDKIYVADSYNSRIQTFQLIAGGVK